MSQKSRAQATGLDSPAARHAALVPSDTVDLTHRPRAVYCEASGTAVLRDGSGTELSYELQRGQILPLRPVRLMATGTTATLYGWW